jgi:hypothetical protein
MGQSLLVPEPLVNGAYIHSCQGAHHLLLDYEEQEAGTVYDRTSSG